MDYQEFDIAKELDKSPYTIKLADGRVISNLRLNGNNYISETQITESMFDGNLSEVVITDKNGFEEHHKNMALVQIMKVKQDYLFILRDKSALELWQEQVAANVDYIAMMTDLEL